MKHPSSSSLYWSQKKTYRDKPGDDDASCCHPFVVDRCNYWNESARWSVDVVVGGDVGGKAAWGNDQSRLARSNGDPF